MTDREKTIAHLKAYINCYADRHKTCNQNCILYGHGDCVKYVIESINDALKLLKEQETIFERDGHHIRCTHCNSYWCSTDREGNVFPTNYCPECGRKVKWNDE